MIHTLMNRKTNLKISGQMIVILFLLSSGYSTVVSAGPLSCAASGVACAGALKKSSPGLAGKIGACKALRNCKTLCKAEKKECRQGSKAAKKACIDDCQSSGIHGKDLKHCKKECKAGKRLSKKACRSDKKSCKNDCRGNFKTPACQSARAAATGSIAASIAACATVVSCIAPAP
ncbi:MAG TPA: hypothetical protein ENJ84_14280 [Gammaproteobacteria bacterium]|nr:hypothetical protein [Gammaproteobacteria bacterium]